MVHSESSWLPFLSPDPISYWLLTGIRADGLTPITGMPCQQTFVVNNKTPQTAYTHRTDDFSALTRNRPSQPFCVRKATQVIRLESTDVVPACRKKQGFTYTLCYLSMYRYSGNVSSFLRLLELLKWRLSLDRFSSQPWPVNVVCSFLDIDCHLTARQTARRRTCRQN